LYVRRLLGLRPAPEFEEWLERMGILDGAGQLTGVAERKLLGGQLALEES
jgi:ethanolamine ammonia-lyase large subunit